MKKLLVLVSFLIGSSLALGADFLPGKFVLYSTPNYTPQGVCDLGVEVIFDESLYFGRFIYLSDFVGGICEMRISPNQRIYRVEKVYTDSCGSSHYEGVRYDENGPIVLKVADHRTRQCENLFQNEIFIEEGTTVYYSGARF